MEQDLELESVNSTVMSSTKTDAGKEQRRRQFVRNFPVARMLNSSTGSQHNKLIMMVSKQTLSGFFYSNDIKVVVVMIISFCVSSLVSIQGPSRPIN